jgi:hypothetical protein
MKRGSLLAIDEQARKSPRERLVSRGGWGVANYLCLISLFESIECYFWIINTPGTRNIQDFFLLLAQFTA